MNYSYAGNLLKIDGKQVDFFSPIKDVLEIDNVLLVLLQRVGIELDSRDSMNRNVYAFNAFGEKLWEIQEPPSGGEKDKPYTAIYIDSDELVAYNGLGFEYQLNLTDGSVISRGGRPW